jgi:hypothetical protein
MIGGVSNGGRCVLPLCIFSFIPSTSCCSSSICNVSDQMLKAEIDGTYDTWLKEEMYTKTWLKKTKVKDRLADIDTDEVHGFFGQRLQKLLLNVPGLGTTFGLCVLGSITWNFLTIWITNNLALWNETFLYGSNCTMSNIHSAPSQMKQSWNIK